MTPPPFTFELIVTGLCLITLQADNFGNDVGAKFNFLDAPGGQTVCGEDFEDGHVPSLTFNLADLSDGSMADYTEHRLPDGTYVGVFPLTGANLCVHPYPDKDSNDQPKHGFSVLHNRKNEEQPAGKVTDEDFGWIASLRNVDSRAANLHGTAPYAGTIATSFGLLKSREMALQADGKTPIVWKLEGPKVPTNPKLPRPDYPKAFAGAAVLHFTDVGDRVELLDCATAEPLLVFRPSAEAMTKGNPSVTVVAANLPKHNPRSGHIHPMAHFLWYYHLLDWTTNGPGRCPEDVALPAKPADMSGEIFAITGSSVFCPPATP